MKEILGAIAVACEIGSALFYFTDIYRGNTKPHLYTMIVWSIISGIAFLGMMVGGGAAGAWGTGAAFLYCSSLVPIAWFYGTKDITLTDKLFLLGALTAIGLWILADNPLWAVLLATVIDTCGMVPTWRKTWRDPTTESLSAWYLAVSRSVFQILALGAYSPLTLVYQIEVLFTDVILVCIIIGRRRSAIKVAR